LSANISLYLENGITQRHNFSGRKWYWYVSYRSESFAMTLSDLDRSFQLPDTSSCPIVTGSKEPYRNCWGRKVQTWNVNRFDNKLCGRPPQYAPPLRVDLWPFDLESGVRVTCDVGYLCANFSLPLFST